MKVADFIAAAWNQVGTTMTVTDSRSRFLPVSLSTYLSRHFSVFCQALRHRFSDWRGEVWNLRIDITYVRLGDMYQEESGPGKSILAR